MARELIVEDEGLKEGLEWLKSKFSKNNDIEYTPQPKKDEKPFNPITLPILEEEEEEKELKTYIIESQTASETVNKTEQKALAQFIGKGKIYFGFLHFNKSTCEIGLNIDNHFFGELVSTLGGTQQILAAKSQGWWFDRYDTVNDVYVASNTPNPAIPFHRSVQLMVRAKTDTVTISRAILVIEGEGVEK